MPPPAVDGFDRVQHITALGVTLCHDFYMSEHIDGACHNKLCTHSLRSPNTTSSWYAQASLQLIFWTSALAKLLYAAPVWWGFANSGEMNRLEVFRRTAGKSGYYCTLAIALCEQADEQLFRALRYNPIHLLYRLLPSERSTPYLMRYRVHNYELPSKNRCIDECNFICRVLYKDCF